MGKNVNLTVMQALRLLSFCFLLQSCASTLDMGSARLAYDQGNYDTALIFYREQAALNNSEAEFMLGRMYHAGEGVKPQHSQAITWYRRAADQGYGPAQMALATLLFDDQKYADASTYYESAAMDGNSEAKFKLGKIYKEGLGVSPNFSRAFSYFSQAADANHSGAQFELGKMYHSGQGVDLDANTARALIKRSAENGYGPAQLMMVLENSDTASPEQLAKWNKSAADQGIKEAQNNIGNAYRDGIGVPQNEDFAYTYYKMAAEQGLSDAQYNLGNHYRRAQGVDRDLGEAVRWYRAAADQNHRNAEYDLGSMYYIGLGVDQDVKNATAWFRRAGNNGHPIAQYFLGNIYRNGEGVIVDQKEALKWYLLAAEQNVPEAQNNLGYMYSNGQGVERNYLLSHMWFSISLINDNLGAQQAKQFIESEMTDEEIQKANQMAREWLDARGL